VDQFENLPVIKLGRFETNDPTHLNEMQRALWPHLSAIETVWWILWWGVLAYLFIKYVLVPRLSKYRNQT